MTIQKKAEWILAKDDHEFWRGDAPKSIVSIHKKLVGFGLDKEQAASIIQDVWGVAAGEYGD